jgi:hypothetical protein
MAFAVARPNGTFEIRESRTTSKGPRARTLVTFHVLDEDVLARLEERADRGVDRAEVVASARRAGAPIRVHESAADGAARALIRECITGRFPSPAVAAVVKAVVPTHDISDAVLDAVEWMGASEVRRSDALRDLLELGDRFPAPSAKALRFPHLGRQR